MIIKNIYTNNYTSYVSHENVLLKNFLLQIVGASIFKKNWSKKHQGRGLKIKIIIAVYWLKDLPSGFWDLRFSITNDLFSLITGFRLVFPHRRT